MTPEDTFASLAAQDFQWLCELPENANDRQSRKEKPKFNLPSSTSHRPRFVNEKNVVANTNTF
jgi:hypothetical protein